MCTPSPAVLPPCSSALTRCLNGPARALPSHRWVRHCSLATWPSSQVARARSIWQVLLRRSLGELRRDNGPNTAHTIQGCECLAVVLGRCECLAVVPACGACCPGPAMRQPSHAPHADQLVWASHAPDQPCTLHPAPFPLCAWPAELRCARFGRRGRVADLIEALDLVTGAHEVHRPPIYGPRMRA